MINITLNSIITNCTRIFPIYISYRIQGSGDPYTNIGSFSVNIDGNLIIPMNLIVPDTIRCYDFLIESPCSSYTQTICVGGTTTTTTSTSTSTSTTTTTSSSTTTTTTPAQYEGFIWYGDTDPYPDLSLNNDSLIYPESFLRPVTDTNISVNFPVGATGDDGKFLVIKVPASRLDMNNWNNGSSPFNYGNIPDIAFRERLTFGGFDYYITRNPFFFDFAEPTYNITLT